MLQNTTAKQAIISIATALNSTPSVITSEGANTNQQSTLQHNNKHNTISPMTNEAFQELLNSLPNKTPNENKTPVTKTPFGTPTYTLRYNIPTPKSSNKFQPSIPTSNVPLNRHIGKPRITPYTHTKPTIHQKLQYLQAQHIAHTLNHIFENGKKQSLDMLLKGPMKDIWNNSTSRELGRLAKGWKNEAGNEALEFIPKSEVPQHEKVTYANMVCDLREHKQDKFRVRLTVGGDKLEYFFETAAPAASLLEAKLIINSTISQSSKNARFMTLDIKDFFLQSTMKHPQYMKIHAKYFSKEFRDMYDIEKIIANDGYVYCKIVKGMYGLKQAARLAYDALVTHLHKYGYTPDKYAPNIWKHETRPTKFCLCVDDFGIQTFSNDDTDHLLNALKDMYKISTDFTGTDYCV